jgi:signal transduction histidine kinase/CheY-like chemotaxis protein
MTDQHATTRLAELRDVLQVVATSAAPSDALTRLAHWVERSDPGSRCSILRYDAAAGALRHGAGPSLPDAYNALVDGLAVGEGVGSCGTVVARGAPVLVGDIASSPLWAPFAALVAPFGLAACWSHPVRAADGAVIGTFAIYRAERGLPSPEQLALMADGAALAALVIERARLAAEQAAEVEQQQSDKMESLGTLAGGIAHDVNNMLAAVLGHAQLALDGVGEAPGTSTVAAHLRQIEAAARRAKDVVAQILTFSRKQPLRKLPVDAAACYGEAVAMLRAALPAGVALEVALPEVGLVLGDAGQLQQVLVNLVTNAEYAVRGRPAARIALSLDVVTVPPAEADPAGVRPGPFARLRVRDNGVGMPPAIQARVLEPFFTTKPVGEGTGLGLSVVHGIVRAHGGLLRLESGEGAGTTVTVLLPTGTGPATPLPDATATAVPTRTGAILVVDDEVQVAEVLAATLRRAGHTVRVATDPRAALGLAHGPAPIELVLSDVAMPGMDGLELVRRIREARPGVPALLCTGYVDGDVPPELAASGPTALLLKPVELRELVRTAGALLAGGAPAYS